MSDPLGNARQQGMDESLTGARGPEFDERGGDDDLSESKIPVNSYGSKVFHLVQMDPGAEDRVVAPTGTMIRPFYCDETSKLGSSDPLWSRDEARPFSQQSPLYDSSGKGKPSSSLRSGAGSELEEHNTPTGGNVFAVDGSRLSKNDRV
jgi:hypothetical protein